MGMFAVEWLLICDGCLAEINADGACGYEAEQAARVAGWECDGNDTVNCRVLCPTCARTTGGTA